MFHVTRKILCQSPEVYTLSILILRMEADLTGYLRRQCEYTPVYIISVHFDRCF